MVLNLTSRLIFISLCSVAILACGCTGERILVINYGKVVFNEKHGSVTAVDSTDEDFVFRVATQPGKLYHLGAISEAEAKLIGSEEKQAGNDVNYWIGTVCYLYFRDGKPWSIHIQGRDVQFAKSSTDTFIQLPASRKEVIKAFGEPISIESPFPSVH